jgi:broad specificity phosphatase PhoE
MRHGETYVPRAETRLPGPEEDPHLPLTERGRGRVQEVARWMGEVRLSAVYSSPYTRSFETARAVGSLQGLHPTPLEPLRELAIHPPPGGTLGDVARRYVSIVRDLQQKSEFDVLLDCGRSLGRVVDEACAAVEQAVAGHEGTVLVVAHGGLNRFLLGRWLGMPAARAIAIEQNFACVNVIEFRGGHPWVRAVNLTLHDPLKLGDAGV